MARKCKGCKTQAPGTAQLTELFGMPEDQYVRHVQTHLQELTDRMNPNNFPSVKDMYESMARYLSIPPTKENLLKIAALFTFVSALIKALGEMEHAKLGVSVSPGEMPSMFR